MVWTVISDNLPEHRQKGEVTCLVSWMGKVLSHDDVDSEVIFAGCDDGTITMYREDLGLEKQWKAHKDWGVNDMALSIIGEGRQSSVVLFSCSAFGEINKWWPAAFELWFQGSSQTPGSESKGFTSAAGLLDSSVKRLVWHDDFLYSGDDAGKLCKWNSDLGVEWYKDSYSDISSLSINKSGDHLISMTASPVQSQVIIGDLKPSRSQDNTLPILTTLRGKSPVTAYRTESNLEMVCANWNDFSILVYRFDKTWTRVFKLEGHTDTVSCVTVSSSQKLLASGGWDGKVLIWNLSTGDKITELKCGDYVNCLCWSHKYTGVLYVGGPNGQLYKLEDIQ